MGIFKRLRKQIAVGLLLLLFTNIVQAADSEYNWKYYSNANYQNEVFFDGGKIYVATVGGGLLISADGGNTWVNKTMAHGLGSNDVRDVYASGNNIYAATWGTGLSISTDSGSTWTNKTATLGMEYAYFYGVYVSGSTIYASGYGLSISTDGGNTWIKKTTADGLINDSVFDVYASGTNIYAATQGGLSISIDGGNTWINKTSANGLIHNMTYGVYASGSNIYVAGYNGLSISTDDGSSWIKKSTSNANRIYAVGSNIYAATNGGVAISADNGVTWSNKTMANGLGNNTVKGVYVAGAAIYAATSGGGLSISTDNGENWSNKTIANSLGHYAVYRVYASGTHIYAATNGGLSISTDGGITWINKTIANGLGNNTVRDAYANGSNIYAATDSGLSISSDGGNTWINKTMTNGLGSNTVLGVYVSGTNIYAETNGGLSISTDGGSSFANKTTTNGLGNNTVYDVYVSGTTIYAATYGGLSISTDGGSSFANKTTTNGLGNNIVYGVYVSGSNIYAGTYSGGLSISIDGGATWTKKTTAQGLGHNNVLGVYAVGTNVYAATQDGLSISTDSGNTWVNKTIAQGLGNNTVHDIYVLGSIIYAATQGGLSVATPRSVGGGGVLTSSIFSYLFNKSGDEVTYSASKSGSAFGTITMRESKLGIGTLAESNFSNVVMNITAAGKPSLTIPESNAIAATINADTLNNAAVTASFTGLPKQATGKVPPIIMNGVQVSDSKGNVFPAYTGYLRNISWDNNTGTMTFEILHFTEYGVPVLIGKTFSGTAANAALNTNGTNINVAYTGGSITGTVDHDRTVTVRKISGLSYETVLTDVPATVNDLYRPLVPGVTYNISFEYINRGNATDQIDLTTAIERANAGHFTVLGDQSRSVAPWQVASFNVEIDADNALAYERATVDVTIDINGETPVSYNGFSEAYQGGTFASDGRYGGADNLSHRFVLEAQGYDLTILSRGVTVNAPAGYTGTPVSETNLVPGATIKYSIAVRNNNYAVATSINITDVIPNACHLYYTDLPSVEGAQSWAWRGATDNMATTATSEAVKFEITIPARATVTASYTVTLD